MRWFLTLQDYDFIIKHIPGAQNSKADILSRLPWYKEEIPDQEEFSLLDAKRFVKQVRFGKKVCSLQPVALFMEEQFWTEGKNTNNTFCANKCTITHQRKGCKINSKHKLPKIPT